MKFDGIVQLSEVSNLPNCPAVYYIVRIEKIAYIGQTVNLNKRFTNHHRIEDFLGLDDAYICWINKPATELLSYEFSQVQYHKPPLNKPLGRPLDSGDYPVKIFARVSKEDANLIKELASGNVSEGVRRLCAEYRRLIAADMDAPTAP